jgi:hypothetical protein
MSARPKRPLTRDHAWAYVLLNISVPGWGSLKAGRIFAGLGELAIVVTGLVMLAAWFFEWMNRIVQSEIGDSLPPVPPAWLWQGGVISCVISWVWTIITCVSLMREARAYEAEVRRNTPPVLAEIPKPPRLS